MKVTQMNASSKKSPLPPPPIINQDYEPHKKSRPLFDIKSFAADDWILLAIIVTLILEGSEDYILLCALGYLFIVGL